MAAKRTAQVGEAIREHVALMLARGEISDPRVRNVTLNAVKVSPDLQIARIYYSVLGSEAVRKEVAQGLKNAAGFMRRSLGDALKMRYTPSLTFFYDETIERAARMGEVFADIARDRAEHPVQEDTGGDAVESAPRTEGNESERSDSETK